MEDKAKYEAGGAKRTTDDCVRLAGEISASVREIASDVDAIVAGLIEVPKIKGLVNDNAEELYNTMDAVATVLAGVRGVVAGAKKVNKLPKSVRAFLVGKALKYFSRKDE